MNGEFGRAVWPANILHIYRSLSNVHCRTPSPGDAAAEGEGGGRGGEMGRGIFNQRIQPSLGEVWLRAAMQLHQPRRPRRSVSLQARPCPGTAGHVVCGPPGIH